MNKRAWLAVVGGALLLGGAAAAGCSKDESFVTADQVEAEISGAVNEAIPKCTPGFARDCPCPMGATGVQTCAADGKSYSACSDCWSAMPTSGSSSSGGGGAMTQKVTCDPIKNIAIAMYPGLKAEDLLGVRSFIHDPNAAAPLYQCTPHYADGAVTCECLHDYDLFIGP